MSRIVVIGSANMDTTHYLRGEFPEQVTGESLNEIERTARVLGGKGANQARATKLQSTDDKVYFIGCIGEDKSASSILDEFLKVQIDFRGTKVVHANTDGRIIYVDKNGENRMMGYGDCIKQLTPDMIDTAILEKADIVAIQLKMPPETAEFVINYCEEHGKTLVIDPTPPEKAGILLKNNAELLRKAAYLTPNEEEAFALIKYQEGKTMEEIKAEFKATPKETRLKAIEELVKKFPNVVATIGGDGVIYNRNGNVIRKATYPTVCKDSTGAGDTFNGAFIAAISRKETLDRAIEYGLMASSMKVRYPGAQNGVPTYEQTKKALDDYEKRVKTSDDDTGNR